MLELIHDARSGHRLEIVIPVMNEGRRLANILNAYGRDFDVVLLDGGSSDNTVQLAIGSGASVFRRCGPEGVGENHYVYYVNEATKSGYCFYMFADEYVSKSDLMHVNNALRGGCAAVLGKRIDWLYGKCVGGNSRGIRGLRTGNAVYDADNLHGSLRCKEQTGRMECIDVHHLHVWSIGKYFGTAGMYAHREIHQFRARKKFFRLFARRYIANELIKLPLRLLRAQTHDPVLCTWSVILSIMVFFMGTLCWLEQKYLLSEQDQLSIYAKFYEVGIARS